MTRIRPPKRPLKFAAASLAFALLAARLAETRTAVGAERPRCAALQHKGPPRSTAFSTSAPA